MLLVAPHKVLGLACSPTLALFFLLPPLVTAHPASKIGSSAFSQQRKCRSYNLTMDSSFAAWDAVASCVHTHKGRGRCPRPPVSWTEVVGCTRQGQVLTHVGVSAEYVEHFRFLCGKKENADAQRLAWTVCDSETSFQVREVFFSRAFQTFHWSHFVFYKWLNINWGRELNLRSSKSLWVL